MWTLRVDLGGVLSLILLGGEGFWGHLCIQNARRCRGQTECLVERCQDSGSFRNPGIVAAIAEVDGRRVGYFEFLQTVLWSLT